MSFNEEQYFNDKSNGLPDTTPLTDVDTDEQEKIKKLVDDIKANKAQTCPRCNNQSLVVSIFGSICSRCFYEPKGDE